MKKSKLKAPKKPKLPNIPWKPTPPEESWEHEKMIPVGTICSYNELRYFTIGDLKKIISLLDDDTKYIIQQQYGGDAVLMVFEQQKIKNEKYEQQLANYEQRLLEYNLEYDNFEQELKKYEKRFEKYLEELTLYQKKLSEDEILQIRKHK